jgi:hypothetical protein
MVNGELPTHYSFPVLIEFGAGCNFFSVSANKLTFSAMFGSKVASCAGMNAALPQNEMNHAEQVDY